MATIHKLTKDGATIFPATITDAVVHPQTGKTLTSMIKDYNVSELFPTEGIDGGNKYNLALAIQVLGTHLSAAQKTGGIKLTFISSVSPYPEEEYYLGKSSWSATASDWDQRFEVGDVIADPSGSWTPGTAEAYIDQQVAIVTGNLASETLARQTADQSLQNQINAEATTRTNVDNTKADKATTLAGYGITNAYTKTEVNDLVDTPHQNYVTVQTYSDLPATGSADTIYRVSSYDGSVPEVNVTKYSEYAWSTSLSQYIFLCVKSQIDEVFDITVYHSNTTYSDLASALGTDGVNIPPTLRRGGMSVKYVQTSDNKYVQYFLTKDEWSANVSDWEKTNLKDEVNALNDQVNGKQKTTVYATFTAVYQFVELDSVIPSGTIVKNSGTVNVGLYDNMTDKHQVGTNLVAGNSLTIDADVKVVRLLSAIPSGSASVESVLEYGEEIQGLVSKVSELQNKVGEISDIVISGTVSSQFDYFYEFTPALPIGSVIVNNGTFMVSLYDASKSNSVNVYPGFEVVTSEQYKYIKNSSFTGTYNIVIRGSVNKDIAKTKTDIENKVNVSKATIELNKWIGVDGSNAGIIVYNTGSAISRPIELHNGKGFNVKCAVNPTGVRFYSGLPCDDTTYIEHSNFEIPNNAKYAILLWDQTAVSTEGFANQEVNLIDIESINSQLVGSYHKFREDFITTMSDETFEKYYTQTCAVKELYIKDSSLKNDNLRLSIENTTTNKRIVVNGDSTSPVNYSVPEESSNGIYTLENDLLYLVVDMSMMSGLSTNMADTNALRLTLASFTKIESEQPTPTPTEDKITTDELEVLDWSDKYTATNKGIWRSTTSSHTGGAEISDSSRDATPYLDLEGVVEVFMKLPAVLTAAGAAWYNSEKVCLETIDSSNQIDNAKSELWLTVPYGARYLRTCVDKTDAPYILKVKAKKQIPVLTAARESYLLNPMIMPLTSRVFATYSDFVDGNNEPITTSRVPLNEASGGSGEQIMLGFNNRLLRHTATAAISVNDSDSIITWGNKDVPLINLDNYIATVEARFYNEGGIGKLSVVKKNSDGTDAVVATTKTLSFNVVAGNTYHIGYRKVEFDTPDANDKAYGYGEFFVKLGDTEETQRFIYDNTIKYPTGAQSGEPTVRSDSLAGLCGKPYFGIKSGDVVYTNFYVSTDYDPQVKGMIIGDSLIGANTLSGAGNIHKKYATLLQNDLGRDSFMVIGKGGEAVDSIVNQFAPYDIAAFKPTYLIVALGSNNHSFDEYLGSLNQMLDMLKARHVEPILTTITPIRPSTTTTNEDVLQAINSWVRGSGYRYVDIFNAVAEVVNGQSVWKSGMVLPDGVHPTVAGHQAIYEAFVRELPEIFEV